MKFKGYIKRISYVVNRWRGQWKYFAPSIAVCDFLVTTVFRHNNGFMKHKLNEHLYYKAENIVKDRYRYVIKKWENKDIKENNYILENCNIFCFWWQGIENAPKLIKECIKNIEKYSGKHKVIVIDKDNFMDFTNVPSYILENVENGNINFTLFSDILRCCLLYDNGGIWIDPTCYLTRNLDDEIYTKKFYSIKHGNDWEHPICKGYWATFFIASSYHNELIGFVRDMFFEYWKYEKSFVVYLSIDLFLSIAYEEFEYAMEMIDEIPYNNIKRDDLLNLLKRNNGKYFDDFIKRIDKQTYIHKLTYKIDIEKFR